MLLLGLSLVFLLVLLELASLALPMASVRVLSALLPALLA